MSVSSSSMLFGFLFLIYSLETLQAEVICVGEQPLNGHSTNTGAECSRIVGSLLEAAQVVTHDSLIQLLRGEEALNSAVIKLQNIYNLTITSSINTRIVCHQQAVDSGLTLINITNLAISRVRIESCGALHNVSDYNGTLEYYFSSAIYLENCTNVNINDITVRNSYGTGLSLFNNNGFITIHHSIFSNNTVIPDSFITTNLFLGGGGIYFELSECSPQWQGCDPHSNAFDSNNTVHIYACTFSDNSVIADPDNIQFTNFRGGGLIFWLRGTSYNNTALIEDNLITGNSGLYGGGMFVQLKGSPTYNNVTIRNVTSRNNMARLGGGGIDLGYYSVRPHLNRHNNITVISCNIMNNRASFGGGSAFFSTLVSQTDPNNRVEFRDTLWMMNKATYGSAIYLEPVINDIPANSFFPIPHFVDCNFTQNYIMESSDGNTAGVSVSSVGAGAMNSKAISMTLEGSILFNANNGTAVYIIDCIFIVEENATINFTNNTGTYGGAMSINGFASIYVKPNVSFSFLHNMATVKGGAIYFYSTDIKTSLLTGSSCFVERFRTRDGLFETSFYFENNTDSFNKTLYISSLLPCNKLCQGTHVYLNYIPPERLLTDECIGNFTFMDYSGSIPGNIATETSEFVHDNTVSDVFSVVPGKDFKIPFTTRDELGHDSPEPLFAVLSGSDPNRPNLQNIYTANKRFQIKGQPNDTGHLEIGTLYFRNLTVGLNIKLSECPPGFINRNNTCLCSADDIKQHYDGIVRCDNQEFQASIVPGLWVGYEGEPSEDNLYTGTCPSGYCTEANNHSLSVKLPSVPNVTELNSLICGGKNRSGTLCGQCIENTAVYFNSPSFKCGSNKDCSVGAVYYILSSILPLTLLFTIVVLYGINFSSGAWNGFVFYAQIINYFTNNVVYSSKSEQVLHVISVLFYGPFSLKFFHDDYFSFCLFKNGNFLTIMAMEALSLIFAFILVVLLVVFMKSNYFFKLQSICCKRPKFKPTTLTKALTTFLILCYTQMTQICFEVLHIGLLYGKGGGVASARVFRMGNQHYFSGWHILCGIAAIVGILTIVTITPLCLVLYPVIFKAIPASFQEKRIVASCIAKIESLKPVFDAFQGSYKDEYRFFAGLYFLYRAMFVGVFALIGIHLASLSIAQVIIMVLLSLHLWLQPYQKPLHNRIDGALFLCLGVITTLTFTRHFEATSQAQHGILTFTGLLQLAFVYIPGIVATVTLIVLVVRKCSKKYIKKRNGAKAKKEEKNELNEALQHQHHHTVTTSYLNMNDDDTLRDELQVLNIN